MEQNRTSGSILKTLLAFSLPYLLSYFLQTLYGLADLFIIGQFGDVAGTTAVSVGSQVMHMVTVVIVGLAMGTTVMIGRAVGAGRREEASRAVGNTILLFIGVAILLTVVLLLLRNPIITVMQTPEEAVAGLTDYLTICFLGIPFITAYNVISSIFRGMGDSKSPMYFIAVACCANIILDYVFIGALGLGPAGAALGTTLAQTCSVIISLIVIIKKKMLYLTRQSFRPSASVMKGLLSVGVPVALQDGFIQVSFLIITAIANSRGLTDAAAVGIVEKIIGILFLVPSSMLSAVSALCAQNMGAGLYERAKKTLFYAIGIATGFGLVAAACMAFAAEAVVGLFVSGGDAAVIHAGAQYLHGYVWDCVLAGIHFCFSGYFCACKKSGISFLHNTISIICARVPLAYLASSMFPDTLMPMGVATAIGSGVSVIVCLIAYSLMKRKNPKEMGYQ
ncbi:MAG: MATE family efflux transporter [Clostridiales bacterium]|nr:MATE family efflux transporter [Clostridiales bacterium]